MTDTQFLHLDSMHIVNISQIVAVRRLEPEPAREVISYGERNTIKAKPFRVEVTLTALESEQAWNGDTAAGVAGISWVITVSGENAENVWEWFSSRAILPMLDTVPA